MKKLFTSLMLLVTVASFAQENGIKINTSSMLWGNLGVHYERVINDKSSFQVGATFLLPRTSVLGLEFTEDDGTTTTTVDVADVVVSGFALHGEYRMYTAQNAPKGFYWGPWARYYRYGVNTKEVVNGYNHETTVGLGSMSLGIQIGYQWIISDRVAIDWTFIGLGINRMNLFGTYKTNEPGYTAEKVEAEYEDFPLFGSRATFEETNDGFKMNAPFMWGALKSSFRVGIFF